MAPGSPQPQLSLARLETERADSLDEFLARRIAAENAPFDDEYSPAVEADLARLVAQRDGAFSRALEAVDRADKAWSPAPEPALTRARALRVWAERTRGPVERGERLSAAALAYEEAARRAPNWPEVVDESAWVELLRDSPARSVALAEAAVAMDRFYLPAHRTAADALAARGEDEAALGHYRQYFADDRNGGDLPALRGMLAVLQRLGRTADALAVGETIVMLSPGSAHAWADVAVLRQAVADLDGALEAARRAAELDPDDEGIAALVSGLERR
jgi:tetratricopeptide (TPR) repeat protein